MTVDTVDVTANLASWEVQDDASDFVAVDKSMMHVAENNLLSFNTRAFLAKYDDAERLVYLKVHSGSLTELDKYAHRAVIVDAASGESFTVAEFVNRLQERNSNTAVAE